MITRILNRLNNWSLFNIIQQKTRKLFTDKYLLFTNTGICVVLGGAGDVLQQNYEMLQKRQTKWDTRRTFHFQCASFVVGPVVHYYYQFLDKLFPGTAFKTIAKKISMDMLIFSPVNIVIFFVAMGLLEGLAMKDVNREIIDKGKYLYAAECFIWPPAQAINFYFLPTRYRVLYDNTISLGFDYYYSYVKYKKDYKVVVYDDFRDLHQATCSTANRRWLRHAEVSVQNNAVIVNREKSVCGHESSVFLKK